MTHPLYSVFIHPAPFNGKKWAVQFPRGIITYKTKGKAIEIATELKIQAEMRKIDYEEF
jgi:hypothetical protein